MLRPRGARTGVLPIGRYVTQQQATETASPRLKTTVLFCFPHLASLRLCVELLTLLSLQRARLSLS